MTSPFFPQQFNYCTEPVFVYSLSFPILLYIQHNFTVKVSHYPPKKSFVLSDVLHHWFTEDIKFPTQLSGLTQVLRMLLPSFHMKKIHICYLYVYQCKYFTDIRGALMALEHISSKTTIAIESKLPCRPINILTRTSLGFNIVNKTQREGRLPALTLYSKAIRFIHCF